MIDAFGATLTVVSAGLIVAAFATVSLFAALFSAGIMGLAASALYIRGGAS